MNGLFWGLLTIDLHFFADHFPEENSKTKVKSFRAKNKLRKLLNRYDISE